MVTQDEIKKMAELAGFNVNGDLILDDMGYVTITKRLEAFAKLVANKEREAIINLIPGGFSVDPQWLCDAIRARGEAT